MEHTGKQDGAQEGMDAAIAGQAPLHEAQEQADLGSQAQQSCHHARP